ncbi:MAG: chlorite dismutase family protein [Actinomycetota bacterium]
MSEGRAIYRYVMYRVDPAWRGLPDDDRALHKKEFAAALVAMEGVAVFPYSTVGMRADSDLCLWEVAQSAEALQSAQTVLNGTALGRWLLPTHSFLAMTRKSEYLGGHTHAGQEGARPPGPQGGSYLFVYPMDKLRPWYRLPFEDRKRMMGEHFKIGHKYPNIKIHTGYSFGLDDQEFIVAFEGESLGEFLDLVQELRGSEASAYTARDVPIFTCVRMPIEQILDQLDGFRAG